MPSPLTSPNATRTPPAKSGPKGKPLTISLPSVALNSRTSPPPPAAGPTRMTGAGTWATLVARKRAARPQVMKKRNFMASIAATNDKTATYRGLLDDVRPT